MQANVRASVHRTMASLPKTSEVLLGKALHDEPQPNSLFEAELSPAELSDTERAGSHN